MKTLTFRGSSFSYQPTRIPTRLEQNYTTKYRGQAAEIRQAIAPSNTSKGLTYRGIAY